VGLGHIAQAAVLPAFGHARRNSRLTALVSDDSTKQTKLSKKYRVESTFPTGRQRIVRPGVQEPELVKVQSASE